MVSIQHLLMIINSILSVKFLAKHWTWSLSFKTCYGREVLQSQNWYKIYWFENRCIWYNRFLPFRRLLRNNIRGLLTSPPHNVIQKKQSNVFILCSLWFTYIPTYLHRLPVVLLITKCRLASFLGSLIQLFLAINCQKW